MNNLIEPNHIKGIYLLITLHIASYYTNKINLSGAIIIGLSIILGFVIIDRWYLGKNIKNFRNTKNINLSGYDKNDNLAIYSNNNIENFQDGTNQIEKIKDLTEDTLYNAIINPPNALNFWIKDETSVGGYFDIGNANTIYFRRC